MRLTRLRQSLVAVFVLVAFLAQGTWVLAGTTGTIGGNVYDASSNNAPVAGAKVTATSPSQAASVTTDSSGHFVFLTLAPDTYTVSVEKQGYDPVSQSGITVFADQSQTLTVNVQRTLRVIGRVTSRAASDIVKSGQTSNVYSINSASAQALQSLGGGQNLENAYSAIAAAPGVTAGYGSVGWGQTLYIHGSNYGQIGYEYDGVPVNRAFDNYQATTNSNLGQQELQVVTSTVAGSSSSSVAGYVNQVIRTGTYPGFGTGTMSVGAPAFYHSLRGEIGGATPNRNFSYYVGVSGYNQDQRYLDQSNGGSFPAFLNPPTYNSTGNGTGFNQNTVFSSGVYPNCVFPSGADPFALPAGTPGAIPVGTGGDQGCSAQGIPYNVNGVANQADREAVVNLHLGIPHHYDTGKDDIQILYSSQALVAHYYDSIQDDGGLQLINFLNGGGPVSVGWKDAYTFQNGIGFGAPAGTAVATPYFFPSSPANRAFGAPFNPTIRDSQQNDAQIVKLQYQRNFNERSYLRLYGYTFYSDWLLNAPAFYATQYNGFPNGTYGFGPGAGDYELDTHTRGGEIQYANQIDPRNLVTLTGSVVTASIIRSNNSTMLTTKSQPATNLTDGTNCYDINTGALTTCFAYAKNAAGVTGPAGAVSGGTIGAPVPAAPIVGAAAAAGANYQVTYLGYRGTLNTVKPVFSAYALTDQFKASDKLLLNGGVRFENYVYKLPLTSSGPDYKFWFNQASNSFCYDPANGLPVIGKPVPFSDANPIATVPGGACPASTVTGLPTVHPNGVGGNILYTNVIPNPTITRWVGMPRISGTYTLNPDTVVRFGAGVYSEPFLTATTDYLDQGARRASIFNFQKFFGFGFTSPEHQFEPAKSTNLDLSLEKHLRGTDISFKLTPFYRFVKNQYQDFFIGTGFVSDLPVGNETVYGLEFQLQKGDPNRNGLSALLSYTYTGAFMKFNPFSNGSTPVSAINNFIDSYNALTASGNRFGLKGSPCYDGTGSGTPYAGCTVSGSTITMNAAGLASGAVINPYYFNAPQAPLNLIGPYPVYQTFPNPTEFGGGVDSLNGPIVWPHIIAGYLNYKHDRWNVTPNFQLIDGFPGGSNGGARYGSPLSVLGIDPRTCTSNQSAVPTAPNPGLPNYIGCGFSLNQYGAFYIPNPLTGAFDGVGAYRNPWLLNFNMNIGYQISQNVKANLVLSNLFNRCFGGTATPWQAAFPANQTVCNWSANPAYVSNMYNGSSPSDVAANGVAPVKYNLYPYQPGASFLPFTAALQVQVRL